MISVLQDERGKKYIELSNLLLTVGSLKKKPGVLREAETQHSQTPADNIPDTAEVQVLRAKMDALQELMKTKEEVLRLKDEQLRQADARELFYQEELRTVRLLVSPSDRQKPKKRFLGLF